MFYKKGCSIRKDVKQTLSQRPESFLISSLSNHEQGCSGLPFHAIGWSHEIVRFCGMSPAVSSQMCDEASRV